MRIVFRDGDNFCKALAETLCKNCPHPEKLQFLRPIYFAVFNLRYTNLCSEHLKMHEILSCTILSCTTFFIPQKTFISRLTVLLLLNVLLRLYDGSYVVFLFLFLWFFFAADRSKSNGDNEYKVTSTSNAITKSVNLNGGWSAIKSFHC